MKNVNWVEEQKCGTRGYLLKEEEGYGAVLLLYGQAPSNPNDLQDVGTIRNMFLLTWGHLASGSQPRPTSTSEDFLTSCGIHRKS